MKSSSIRFNCIAWTVFRILSAAAVVVSATLLCVAVSASYDTTPGYFQSGVLPVAWIVACLVLSAAAAVVAVLTAKAMRAAGLCGEAGDSRPGKPYLVIGALPVIPFFVEYVKNLIAEPGKFTIYCKIVLLIIAGMYFVLEAFPALQKSIHFKPICGCAYLLWGFVQLASYYLDPVVPINAPLKVLTLLAILSSMMFLSCDIRLSFADGKGHPGWLIYSAFLTSLLGFSYAAVSMLLPEKAGVFAFTQSPHYSVFCLSMSVYAFIRMLQMASAVPAELEPVAGQSETRAEETAEETNEAERVAQDDNEAESDAEDNSDAESNAEED